MFHWLGQFTSRRPIVVIAIWLIALGAGVVGAIRWKDVGPSDVGSFLEPDAPYNRAFESLREAFPDFASRSYIVVLAARPEGLTKQDFRWIDEVERIAQSRSREITGQDRLHCLSPSNPIFRPRLVGRDDAAAMLVINLDRNYISPASIQATELVEDITEEVDRPTGLQVEITGPAGMGRDYFYASQTAVENTAYVTISLVLLILVLVYRSPIGALVPLTAIGASVFLAMISLTGMTFLGWSITNIERIFAVVLLYGAGVDYALFWIARYRENLAHSKEIEAAAYSATVRVAPAIAASAATTICGLLTLMAADLIPWQNAGKALAPILLISLAAALTLTPAIARLLGRWLFWPVKIDHAADLDTKRFWSPLARVVSERPRAVLGLGLVVLGIPALAAPLFQPQFDSLSQMPKGSSSQRGFDIIQKYYAKGAVYPNTILVQFNHDVAPETMEAMAEDITDTLISIDGVVKVHSLSQPLGVSANSSTQSDTEKNHSVSRTISGFLQSGPRRLARAFFSNHDPPAMQALVFIEHSPFALEAMQVVKTIETQTRAVSSKWDNVQAEVSITGLTPYIIGVRDVAGTDQLRIMVLATLTIGLIVYVLVRDWKLTAFMLLATWLTFGATITLSSLFFIHVMGASGLDYKVRLIVFVIIMAVGQDYNIFLVTRLLHKTDKEPLKEHTYRAIVRTGAVISSCGLIMAATLGSLWAGGLALLQQLGFAFALGILIDTFFVRPLVIPGFYLLIHGRHEMADRPSPRV